MATRLLHLEPSLIWASEFIVRHSVSMMTFIYQNILSNLPVQLIIYTR